MKRLAPIDALSGSDTETVQPGSYASTGPSSRFEPPPDLLSASSVNPVDELSDSSSCKMELKEVGLPRKRRRKRARVLSKARKAQGPKENLASDVHCRALLGRNCLSCKRSCLTVFLQKDRFKRFLEFRSNWSSVHKLDQDKSALQLRWTACLSLCFRTPSIPVN